MFLPGQDDQLTRRAPDLRPNEFRESATTVPTPERNTIIAECIMIVVAAALWNLPLLRDAICGIKVGLTVSPHGR